MSGFSLVQESATQTTTGTNTLPAPSTAGNLLIAVVTAASGTAVTPPAGWIAAASTVNGTLCATYIFAYFSNPGGLSSFTFSGPTVAIQGVVAEFTCPSVAQVTAASDSGTANAGAGASVVVTTAGSSHPGDLVILGAQEHLPAASTLTWTDPPGYTELGALSLVSANNHGYAACELSGAGGALSATVTSSVSSTSTNAWTAALATFSVPDPATSGIISVDASTPAAVHASGPAGSPAAVTAAFSPPAGALVAVMVNIMPASVVPSATLSVSDSHGNTYQQLAQVASNAFPAGSGVFCFYYTAAPGSVTVTAHCTALSVSWSLQLAARVLTGAASSQSGVGGAGVNGMAGVLSVLPGAYPLVAACEGGTASRPALTGTVPIDVWVDTVTSGDSGYTGTAAVAGTARVGQGEPGYAWPGWPAASASRAARQNITIGWQGAGTWAAAEITPFAAPGNHLSDSDTSGLTAENTALVINSQPASPLQDEAGNNLLDEAGNTITTESTGGAAFITDSDSGGQAAENVTGIPAFFPVPSTDFALATDGGEHLVISSPALLYSQLPAFPPGRLSPAAWRLHGARALFDPPVDTFTAHPSDTDAATGADTERVQPFSQQFISDSDTSRRPGGTLVFNVHDSDSGSLVDDTAGRSDTGSFTDTGSVAVVITSSDACAGADSQLPVNTRLVSGSDAVTSAETSSVKVHPATSPDTFTATSESAAIRRPALFTGPAIPGLARAGLAQTAFPGGNLGQGVSANPTDADFSAPAADGGERIVSATQILVQGGDSAQFLDTFAQVATVLAVSSDAASGSELGNVAVVGNTGYTGSYSSAYPPESAVSPQDSTSVAATDVSSPLLVLVADQDVVVSSVSEFIAEQVFSKNLSVVQTTSNHSNGTGSLILTFPATLTAGNAVIVVLEAYNGSGTDPISTVRLNDGTSIPERKGRQAAATATNPLVAAYDVFAVTGGQTSVVITMASTLAGNQCNAQAYEVQGLTATLDVLVTSTGTSASWDSTAGATTSPADFWVGFVGTFSTGTAVTTSAPAGWTDLAEIDNSTGTGASQQYTRFRSGYQLTTATGSIDWAGTLSSSVAWAALAIAYQGKTTVSGYPAAYPGTYPGQGPGGSISNLVFDEDSFQATVEGQAVFPNGGPQQVSDSDSVAGIELETVNKPVNTHPADSDAGHGSDTGIAQGGPGGTNLVQSVSDHSNGSATLTLTFSQPLSPGNAVIVPLEAYTGAAGPVSSVTLNDGTPLTAQKFRNVDAISGNPIATVYNVFNVSGGQTSVIVTLAGGTGGGSGGSSPTGTLTYAQLEALWIQAGGTSSDAVTAAAISLAASRGQPGAIQQNQPYSSTAWGAWQLQTGDSVTSIGAEDYQLLDPFANVAGMFLKYTRNGNSFSIASVYNNGKYLQFLQNGVTPNITGVVDAEYSPTGPAPSGTHNSFDTTYSFNPNSGGSPAAFQINAQAYEVGGLTGVLDLEVDSVGSSTSWDTGSSVTTSANEFWVGFAGSFDTGTSVSLTPTGSGWSPLNVISNSTGTGATQQYTRFVSAYQITTATGSIDFAGTISPTAQWAAMAFGYVGSPPGQGAGGGGQQSKSDDDFFSPSDDDNEQIAKQGGGVPPVITSFTPTSGVAGTTVTITGSNLSGATVVTFSGVSASFTVDSDTQITATAPAKVTTGRIAVTTSAGTSTSAANFTVTQPAQFWFTNVAYINGMDSINHSVTAAFFAGSQNFSLNNNAGTVTALPSGYNTTPMLKYISYGQFWADVTGSSKTVGTTTYTPVSGGIDSRYVWLMYDTENWNPNPPSPYATQESQKEIDDPWTYMADFVTLAHQHGYKVMLAPARDLGNDPTSVKPLQSGESLDSWYERTGIATTMGTSGADIAHIQSQADTITGNYASFWNDGSNKVQGADPGTPVTAGISTAYGTASQAAAAAKSVGAAGFWLNLNSTTDESAAVAILQAMGGAPPPPPTVTSFAPTSGVVGTAVTVTGTSFTGATATTFNGTSATFNVASATSITTSVPTGASSGPIAVTTPAGTGASSASFSVSNPAPSITSFTPTSGTSGTSVTITGTSFLGVTSVKFNGSTASFTVNSSTKITATVPTGATTGTITVTTPSGTATSPGSFTVTTSGGGFPGYTGKYGWIFTASNVNQLHSINASVSSNALNNVDCFADSSSTTSTGLSAPFACNPTYREPSFAHFQTVVGTVASNYKWVLYDTEDWNETPTAEINDPWSYMGQFAHLCHQHGLRLIITPARDLGNDTNSKYPKRSGESLSQWCIRTNIFGSAAAGIDLNANPGASSTNGADVVVAQTQSLVGSDNSGAISFWNSVHSQIRAGNPNCWPFSEVSTTYGSAQDKINFLNSTSGDIGSYFSAASADLSSQVIPVLQAIG